VFDGGGLYADGGVLKVIPNLCESPSKIFEVEET